MARIIDLSAVDKSFVKGNRVLKGVTLGINDGEMVGLLGASGSGKSTLIRVICGLETADPGRGTVRLFEKTVQKNGKRTADQRLLRQDVGVIFQQFNLVTRLRLLTNVLAGRLGRMPAWRGWLGLFAREDKIIALKALERVGMAPFARQRASTLSGGQQQRGAIARALAQEARLILADEPIASLDPASAEKVMETLATINREDRVTVVVSLHQIDHAFRHCERIIALKDGEVVFDGPTSKIQPEKIAELYGVEGMDLLGGKSALDADAGQDEAAESKLRPVAAAS